MIHHLLLCFILTDIYKWWGCVLAPSGSITDHLQCLHWTCRRLRLLLERMCTLQSGPTGFCPWCNRHVFAFTFILTLPSIYGAKLTQHNCCNCTRMWALIAISPYKTDNKCNPSYISYSVALILERRRLWMTLFITNSDAVKVNWIRMSNLLQTLRMIWIWIRRC